MTPHAKGLLLTAIGGAALSFDIPMIKLGGGDPWSAMLLRSGTAFVAALVIWQVAQRLTSRTIVLLPGRVGFVIAGLYGLTVVAFVLAVMNTGAANVAFIIAFTPAFTALISWLFLRERPSVATILTILVMMPPVLLYAIGLIPGALAVLLNLAATLWVLYYRFYVARTALETTVPTAIGLVLVDVLLSLTIDLASGRF